MKAVRWIVGLLVVFVGVFVLDLICYNYVFNSELMSLGGLVRSPEELRKLMPVMFGGQFLFALLFTYFFFKLYKDATMLPLRGVIYGFWMGAFVFGLKAVWEFYLFTVSTKLVVMTLALAWTECLLGGLALGLIGWGFPMLLKSMTPKAEAPAPPTPGPIATPPPPPPPPTPPPPPPAG